MIRSILPEPRPLGPFSPRRSPPSCLGSLSSVRLRRRVRNHAIYCRKLKQRQHRHDVASALAFAHALLAGQGPVTRLRRRLAAAGRDDQAQGVLQVIVAHLGHLGYLLADHRMICFGSNVCSAFVRRGGHVSGNVVPQAVPHRDNEHVVAKCHAAARDGGQEGPSGPSRRATEPGSVTLPLGGVEVEAGQHVSMACVISLPPHELLCPKQPVLAVQELRRQVLRRCVPFALLRVPCVKTAPPLPHRGAASPLQSAVKKLLVPRNVADIRSFLGATVYFHEHIQAYAEKSAPLCALLKKNVQFLWTEDCKRAFEQLKADLVSPACLRMPDPEKPFILITGWSKLTVGAVLSQMQPEDPSDAASEDKEYVIAYSSRALNQAESHYAPTEGECLALAWATKKFRQYLHGYKFRVRTDHAALQWLATARFEDSKLECWAMRLKEFDCEVEYLPRDQNVVADHLSRHYPHMKAGSVTAVAGHLAFATEGCVLDIGESGHYSMDPQSWCMNSLQELDQSSDAVARRKHQGWPNAKNYHYLLVLPL